MICRDCKAEVYTHSVTVDSYTQTCPVCDGSNLGSHIKECEPFNTGYQISFDQFQSILGKDETYKYIRADVEKWLKCKISYNAKGAPLIKDEKGIYIPLLAAHLQIQMNKTWQGELYQSAMSIWR